MLRKRVDKICVNSCEHSYALVYSKAVVCGAWGISLRFNALASVCLCTRSYLYPQTPAHFNRAYLFYGRFAHFKCTALQKQHQQEQPACKYIALQQPWIVGAGDNGGGFVAATALAIILVRRSI